MATEYNVYNGTFASKQQMENYEFANSSKPSKSFYHTVECAKRETPFTTMYVATAANTQAASLSGDLRMYYLGLFQLATVGMQSNGIDIGELWVSYEVEFKKPRIQVGQAADGGNGSNIDHFSFSAATTNAINQSPVTGITSPTLFGSGTALILPSPNSNLAGALSPTAIANSVPVLNAQGNPTGALGTSVANSYYFNPGLSKGNYMVSYTALFGTGGVPFNPTVTATNCASLLLIDDDTITGFSNYGTSISAGSTLSANVVFFIQIQKANASFSLVGQASNLANPTYADFFVVEIPNIIN